MPHRHCKWVDVILNTSQPFDGQVFGFAGTRLWLWVGCGATLSGLLLLAFVPENEQNN